MLSCRDLRKSVLYGVRSQRPSREGLLLVKAPTNAACVEGQERLIRLVVLSASLAALILPVSTPAQTTNHHHAQHLRRTHAGDVRWGRKHHWHPRSTCSNANTHACIEEVIIIQHIGEPKANWMRRIPECESSYEATQISGPNEGLYQFNVETWATTPYASHSPLEAYWNTRAASWGYDHLEKGKYEWSCTGILGL